MQPGQFLDERAAKIFSRVNLVASDACAFDPVLYLSWHEWPRRRCHPAAEGADVVLAEASAFSPAARVPHCLVPSFKFRYYSLEANLR